MGRDSGGSGKRETENPVGLFRSSHFLHFLHSPKFLHLPHLPDSAFTVIRKSGKTRVISTGLASSQADVAGRPLAPQSLGKYDAGSPRNNTPGPQQKETWRSPVRCVRRSAHCACGYALLGSCCHARLNVDVKNMGIPAARGPSAAPCFAAQPSVIGFPPRKGARGTPLSQRWKARG